MVSVVVVKPQPSVTRLWFVAASRGGQHLQVLPVAADLHPRPQETQTSAAAQLRDSFAALVIGLIDWRTSCIAPLGANPAFASCWPRPRIAGPWVFRGLVLRWVKYRQTDKLCQAVFRYFYQCADILPPMTTHHTDEKKPAGAGDGVGVCCATAVVSLMGWAGGRHVDDDGRLATTVHGDHQKAKE